MISYRALMTALVGVSGALVTPIAAHAQALPTPSALATSLDLECYQTPGPSLNTSINLTQLNPVLVAKGVPTQLATVGDLAQTCVPVQKDATPPAPSALPFVSQIDFACYHIDVPPLPNPVALKLTHLNPVLVQKGLPKHDVTLTRGTQLCLPVAKNKIVPEGNVLQVAQFLDLECFDTDPGPHPVFSVDLTQLNPQLTGIPPHTMTLGPTPRHLCVPVRKGNQMIPQSILNIVQWIDLEKFRATPAVSITPVAVELQHLNPLFTNVAHMMVTLETAFSLMVPVAKNGHIPPND
jgi:hypothetical protein